jgi:hypothetical protein
VPVKIIRFILLISIVLSFLVMISFRFHINKKYASINTLNVHVLTDVENIKLAVYKSYLNDCISLPAEIAAHYTYVLSEPRYFVFQLPQYPIKIISENDKTNDIIKMIEKLEITQLRYQDGTHCSVILSWYAGSLASGNYTYYLEKVDSLWIVVGKKMESES